MVKKTVSIGQIMQAYVDGRVSGYTLEIIVQPMIDLALPQREFIASKILELIKTSTSEGELISKVQAASPQWLEELKRGSEA